MSIGVIIMAAGRGTRIGPTGTEQNISKVMRTVAGLPMINHVVNAVRSLPSAKICVVAGCHNRSCVQKAVTPLATTILQEKLEGTASAVSAAQKFFSSFRGKDILVVCGDTPLITTDSLETLIRQKRTKKANIALLTFESMSPRGYGRVRFVDDSIYSVIEEPQATTGEKNIGICSAGIMVVDADKIFSLAQKVEKNASGERYLTDIIGMARQRGCSITHTTIHEQEAIGCNTLIDLATAEAAWQRGARHRFLSKGVFMSAPDTVYFSWDTELGIDVAIDPNVIFGIGVKVCDSARIRSFSCLEQCVVGKRSSVGPHARLRVGTNLGADVKVGNFVETKNAHIGDRTRVKHLSYVGDAKLGQDVNVGAGAITCNYDGFNKFETMIKNGVSLGANTALVAPVCVGEEAIVAAGSVVTEDVPRDALVIARTDQKNYKGVAEKFRNKRRKRS